MAGSFGTTALVRHTDPDEATKARIRAEVNFHVFDWVDLSAIETQLVGRKDREVFPWTQTKRREFIEKALAPKLLAGTNLRLVPQFVVTSHEQIQSLTEEMLDLGFEGLMVKDPLAPYHFDRMKCWMKVKPHTTIDLQITGFEEGEGKHVGRLGAIHGQLDGKEIYSAGTGFTDQMREEIWAKRDELIGKWMEVKVQLTDVSEARHPVFMRFRPDRE